MKNGAMDFIVKPFRQQELIDLVQKGLTEDEENRKQKVEKQIILKRVDSLTPREHQVMHMVAQGKLNKVIGFELGINQKTVEFHRSNVMSKMQVVSVAELVKLLASVNMLQ